MNTPLVSIVIPTFNRPQFLPRAIDSALAAAPDGDCEVIVVPNGPDESWKQSLVCWQSDSRVRVSPIETAHGNVARNHGMGLANGKFLRFLDDDDYLLPAAAKQLELLERDGAEVCSGRLRNMDKDGSNLGRVGFPDTHDFICAAVSLSGFTIPACNCFLRNAIVRSRWDPAVHRFQDNAWILDLTAQREWNWIHLDEDVGAWLQHDLPRTSSNSRLTARAEPIVRRLIQLDQHLTANSRNTPHRKEAIAQSLWYYIHRGFPNHPLYWSNVGLAARKISKTARPAAPLFSSFPISQVNPLVAEWLLLPLRAISQVQRSVQETRGKQEYRRRL